ncbi:MAG TPA: GH25 family lysozyme [Polyangiaceae bacterium]|nr:GH25 family lysozyme [Polyangiaceae bacterium]
MAARLVRITPFALACTLGAFGCSSASRTDATCRQSSAARVCASGPIVQGVDVSKYDGTVDWSQAKAAGIQFGFARISDGTANPDAYFSKNWQGMSDGGIVRGAYQYFRASVDPTAQANLVASSLQQAGGLRAGDLPVVMDVETADGQAAAIIEANMRTWLAAVEAKTGSKPIIYTSVGTYPVTTTAFATYPLWVANYGATCPSLPPGWSQWGFWQYSSTGTVTGIGTGNVDRDEFNGTLAQLMAMTSGPSDAGAALGPDGGGSASGGGDADVTDASVGAPADSGGGNAMGEAGSAAGLGDASASGDGGLGGPCGR